MKSSKLTRSQVMKHLKELKRAINAVIDKPIPYNTSEDGLSRQALLSLSTLYNSLHRHLLNQKER